METMNRSNLKNNFNRMCNQQNNPWQRMQWHSNGMNRMKQNGNHSNRNKYPVRTNMQNHFMPQLNNQFGMPHQQESIGKHVDLTTNPMSVNMQNHFNRTNPFGNQQQQSRPEWFHPINPMQQNSTEHHMYNRGRLNGMHNQQFNGGNKPWHVYRARSQSPNYIRRQPHKEYAFDTNYLTPFDSQYHQMTVCDGDKIQQWHRKPLQENFQVMYDPRYDL
ncbi:hypothetical protein GJ496_004493 [Pomphorhynchus laevis]|nr:hypothetical protein GJ496_004493 [Pomphorhynchus laevis]